MEETYRAALACLPGMNVLALPRLISLAGGAGTLWKVLEEGGARAAGLLGTDSAQECCAAARSTSPARLMKELHQQGIRVAVTGGGELPERLSSIYDPPAVLFLMGNPLPPDAPYVAIVGARKASGYGKWASESLAAELARLGIIIVSGGAYGIDAHAHLGCLKAAGFTAAVLGCGIDRSYPAAHQRLFENITESGCLISEYPPGAEPLPWHFPHRNRIIAGLSHAVVVVEAGEKSGALITADMALEEGREVLAVPGPINSFLSLGTNALIQRGAKLVRSIEDICEELPWQPRKNRKEAPRATSGNLIGIELSLVDLLRGGPRSIDWLSSRCERSVAELLPCLTELSLKGWVADEPGGRYRLLQDPRLAAAEPG